jgi:hypothetical protein
MKNKADLISSLEIDWERVEIDVSDMVLGKKWELSLSLGEGEDVRSFS